MEQFFTLSEGILSARSITTWKKKKGKRLSITAEYGSGSSGGPVMDKTGAAIGMVSFTRPVRAQISKTHSYVQMVFKHCIPAELILNLISEK